MSKINLLPSGHFQVTLNDGSIVKGRYSSEALKMLADINGGLSFSDTWTLLAGKNAGVVTYIQLVMCAIKSEGTDFDEFKVLSLFDSLGGIGSDDGQNLLGHFMEGFVPKKKVEQNGVSHGVSS